MNDLIQKIQFFNVSKSIRFLLNSLAKICAWLIIPKIARLSKEFIDMFYTHYCLKQMNCSFKKAHFEYPCVFLGHQNIIIGDNLNILARTRIEAIVEHLGNKYQPEIVIGNNVWINYDCHIGCINRITIGDNCIIASKVFITDHSHGEITSEALDLPPGLRKVISKGPVYIGNNVWIGVGACILPNVIIGNNVIVGSNAVVTKAIPDNAVVGGIPAKIIRIL